jgi:hypothetical protein
MYCRVLNWMSTNVSEARAASFIRAMMEAVCISETSVDIQLGTRQYIPEDSGLLDYFYRFWLTELAPSTMYGASQYIRYILCTAFITVYACRHLSTLRYMIAYIRNMLTNC